MMRVAQAPTQGAKIVQLRAEMSLIGILRAELPPTQPGQVVKTLMCAERTSELAGRMLLALGLKDAPY